MDNNILESDETLVLTLNTVSSGDADISIDNANSSATVTILDDDGTAVNVVTNTEAGEPSMNGVFTVSINSLVAVDTEVYYELAGSATQGLDYTALSGTVTIPAGSLTATIDIQVIDDSIVEGTETVTMTITGTNNAVTVGTSQATMTILDDDRSEMDIITSTEAAEPGTNGLFTINMSNPVAEDTEVYYVLGGSALEKTDYKEMDDSITIPAGATTTTIAIEVIDDTIVEGTETVTMTITGTNNAVTVGSNPKASLNILDNDGAAVSVVTGKDAREPSSNGSFTISISNPVAEATEVSYVLGGSALEETDYKELDDSVTIPAGTTETSIAIEVIDDSIVEGTETVTMTITGTDNAVTVGTAQEATVAILDNDGASVSVVTDKDAREPLSNGSFTISISNPVAEDTEVSYQLGGNAIQGTDYKALGGSVTIPAGATTTTIAIEVIDDAIVEGTETVVVTITGTNNTVTVGNDHETTVSLLDDDVSEVTIETTDNAGEPSNDGLFTITLNQPVQVDTELTIEISGTAQEGIDYESVPNTLTIPAGSTSVTIPIVVIDDDIVEYHGETVIITLTGTDELLVIGEQNEALATIEDDEIVGPSIELIKTASLQGVGDVGDIITYSFEVRNTGNVPLEGIEIDDPLISNDPIFVTELLQPDEMTTVSVAYLVTSSDIDAGGVTNSAFVFASDSASLTTVSDISDNGIKEDGDDNPTYIELVQYLDIAVSKTVSNLRPNIGDDIDFTISVSNLGELDATNLHIEDILAEGYRFKGTTTTAGTYDEASGIWQIDHVAAGATEILVVTVEVLDVFDYENTALLLNLDQTDTDVSNNSSSITIDPICLVFYNEFSPNGDGNNETFKIDCITRYPNNILKVYNRWGNLVYEKQGYNNEWNGVSDGRATIEKDQLLPVGTYFYVISLGDGSEPLTGWLYINR